MPKSINAIKAIGIKIGKLTVIEKVGIDKHGKVLWKCKCDCGNYKNYTTGDLNSGKLVSCGCNRDKILREYGKLQHVRQLGTAKRYVYSMYQCSARHRNIEFNLPFEEFEKLIADNCFYCGSMPSNIKKSRYETCIYNGIDRVDNTKGYIMGNLVTCCKICNIAKHTQSLSEFMNWVKKVYYKLFLIEEFTEEAKA